MLAYQQIISGEKYHSFQTRQCNQQTWSMQYKYMHALIVQICTYYRFTLNKLNKNNLIKNSMICQSISWDLTIIIQIHLFSIKFFLLIKDPALCIAYRFFLLNLNIDPYRKHWDLGQSPSREFQWNWTLKNIILFVSWMMILSNM